MSANGQVRTNPGAMRAMTAALALALLGMVMPFQVVSVAATEPPPAVLTVDTVVDDPTATGCTDGSPADCSLRGALINANADGVAEIETISVPGGTYDLTVPGGGVATGSLNVTASVVIEGVGAAATIIDANGLDRVLVVNGEGPVATRTLIASGLTFRGGRPCAEPGGDDGNNAGGGGLFVHGIAQLTDVIVEDNMTCGVGGGIHADSFGSALTLTRSIIRGNTSFGGGGIQSDFSLTMIDSTVSGNLADRSPGGGLRLAGAATITGSTISDNDATVRGGGITTGDDTTSACCAATVVITNSTISSNVVHWWNSGTPQYFPGVGGGIHSGRSRFTLRHVTVTANVAETNPNYGAVGRGGGIATGYTNFLTLENSIVADNVGLEECRFDAETTYSATGSFGCSVAGLQDPQLGSLAANGGLTETHGLALGNPAIDAGAASLCETFDQRGEPRPSGPGCDMGAFELQVAPPPPPPPPANADLVIDDCSAASLATVTVVTGNLIVTADDCASLALPNLTSIAGDLVVENNATLMELSLPGLGRIDGDLVITGNASLLDIDLGSLTFVGGNLIVTQNSAVDELATAATEVGGDFDISQNATMTVITMPDVETVGGDITMTQNPTLTIITMPAIETVGGDFDVSNNASMTNVSAPSVTTIGGDIDVSNNASMTNVSAPSVTTIGGDMTISGNATLTTIEMSTVTTIGGDIDVSQNATLTGGPALVLHLPALISVGGSIVISDNVQLVTVEAPSMTDVGGDMDVSANATLTTISMPDVETVGGDMILTGNPTLTTFEAPSLETVGGDLTLELEAATIELATVSVDGDTTIVGTGTEMLVAETALGTTSFQLLNGLATLQTTLPDGAFETNVAFSVELLTGSNLDPQGSVDPLAAYHLDFDVPALGVPAAVTFTIDLDEIASADRQSFLDAIASGRATLAVRADGATTFEALTVCATGQTPSADGCIQVLIDGSIVTFNGVAGHFSTWAVVVTAAPDSMAPLVTVPADKQLEATGPTGRTVDFANEVSALDDHDGAVATQCTPESGSTFPIGLTSVTCRAVDAAGNEGFAGFRVTIVDTTGPAVSVPSTVTVPATGSTGALVTFSASATDLVNGPKAVVCSPASGSTFPIGQTSVTCRASDAAGNVGIGSFLVQVLGPVDLLASLRNDVAASTPPLAPKLVADLKGKLDDAISKLAQNKTVDACKKVQEFVTKVDQERAKRTIPAAIAQDWLTRAGQIRTLLGC